eukprot:1193881-Prorocentrum_minimum.AAC.4
MITLFASSTWVVFDHRYSLHSPNASGVPRVLSADRRAGIVRESIEAVQKEVEQLRVRQRAAAAVAAVAPAASAPPVLSTPQGSVHAVKVRPPGH